MRIPFLAPLALVVLTCLACEAPPLPPQPPAQASVLRSATSPPPPASRAPALRLPSTVKPQSYAMTLHLAPDDEHFSGHVDIVVALSEPTDLVWLHAGDNLNVRSAVVDDVSARVTAKTTERAPGDLVGLTFPSKLPAGTHTLTIAWDGSLPLHEGKGAYRQEERGELYIFTQFESVDARRAFPCFDEPGYKTPYSVTLEVPKDQLAFTNTPQTSESELTAGWKRVTFATTKPLPSYLVAFAVGPFEIVDGGKAGANKTPIRIIVPKGKSAEAKYAAATTGKILEQLESYFGIPYPYEKLDHIAVPQKGGAMENPGLITFGTNIILGKPEEKSIRLERSYLSIAAHELGHIWFGDYVTTAWWDDIWLNEAFATWIAAKTVDAMRPGWDGAENRVTSKNAVMINDSLTSTRRIRQPIESHHDIANAFDRITYEKGAAVIGMMEAFVGEDAFKKGVHAYLGHHAFGNATATEFLAEVGAETKKPELFTSAFVSFLDQPGLPLVTATLRCDAGAAPKLLLSQQRYLPEGAKGAAEEQWKIPVCASYPGGKTCTLLSDASAELPLDTKTCPAWVNPNASATGYYRVALTSDQLKKLLDDSGKGLSAAERMNVLGDALALVRSGKLPVADVLARVPTIVQDGNRHLVSMTTGLVAGLNDALVADEQRPAYLRFIGKTYGPRARQLGWTPRAGEDDGTRLLRSGVMALVARDEQGPFAADARKLANGWLDNRKGIDRDLVGTVLYAAARSGDRALWQRLRTEAKKTEDRWERTTMLQAMGAFHDPAIIQDNFALTLADDFDARESVSLLFGAANDPATRPLAWDFLKKNLDRITARLPRDDRAWLIGVGGGFCDAEHQRDVETFFAAKAPGYIGGPRRLTQTVEGISLCTALKSAQQSSVTAFLSKY